MANAPAANASNATLNIIKPISNGEENAEAAGEEEEVTTNAPLANKAKNVDGKINKVGGGGGGARRNKKFTRKTNKKKTAAAKSRRAVATARKSAETSA